MKSFRNSLRLIFLLLTLAALLPVFGSGGEAPTPPFVASIPIPSNWTVTVGEPKSASSSATPRLVSSQFTYTASLRRAISVLSDGSRREDWLTKGYLITRQNNFLYLLDAKREPLSTPLSGQTFAEFGWISAANFTGKEKVRGHDCDLFRDGEMTAAIDTQTKLPVQLTTSGEVSVYNFGEPEVLTLPSDCTERIASYRRERDKLTVNRAPR